jgi:hypothetical protein
MANSRIPSGAAVAILGAIGATAALDTLTIPAQSKPAAQRSIVLAADSTPTAGPIAILPPITAPSASAPPKVAATAKRTPAPAPPHVQTRPLIPPATVAGQLSPPPTPHEALPLATELLPLASPAASPPPKPPTS